MTQTKSTYYKIYYHRKSGTYQYKIVLLTPFQYKMNKSLLGRDLTGSEAVAVKRMTSLNYNLKKEQDNEDN